MRKTTVVAALFVALISAPGDAPIIDAVGKALAGEPPNTAPDVVAARVFDQDGRLVGPVDVPKVAHPPAEWRRILGPKAFNILRSKDTEEPFTGTLLENKSKGVYACAGCSLPLFSSEAKFESGTGWPSFFRPIASENIVESADKSGGMVRTEITCPRCGGHLGHVFDDGPQPTGLRYCLNSAALSFTAADKTAALADPRAKQAPPPKDKAK